MKSKNYEDFVEKFKPKKTTDDCYTPPLVYEAISDWVAKEYNLDKSTFCRPFYPGGDYENYDYSGKIVVDNPPFSLLAKILDFYTRNKIKCFLFAPTLTIFSNKRSYNYTTILCGISITYENGAVVNTSFITNLDDPALQIRTAPTLYKVVKLADNKTLAAIKKQLPKYFYPDNVITSAKLYPFAKYGIDIKIKKSQCHFIRALESQKAKKRLFLALVFLISDSVKAELQKAELQKAELQKAEATETNNWELSSEELLIIKSLGQGGENNAEGD